MSAPLSGPRTAVVVGAGAAGLSAAVRLSDAGWRVLVVERAPRGGGRASVFVDRESGETIDNGQHVLFGCYRETYAFLRRLGADHLAPLQPRLSLALADAHGCAYELRCPDLTPPWHLMAGLLRWRALSFADRLSAGRLVGLIRRARIDGPTAVAARVPASMTVSAWLAAHGQTRRLCEWLWHPLVFAALNQSPDVAAAAPFVRVVAELFGPRIEDAAVGLSRVPLDDLYVHPAMRAIEAAGGSVRLKSHVQLDAATNADRPGTVIIDDEVHAPAAVISAVPWHALASLWPGSPPASLRCLVDDARAMASSPIVTVNLWLDGDVLDRPFVGFVEGPMHWAFDRRAIVGDRLHHLSLVASGAADLAARDNATIAALAFEQLARAVPAARPRRVRRSVVVREQRATFSLAPGGPPRPGPVTPIPGFFLAGDWTDTGLPATIEGAVLSGHRAAAAAIEGVAS